MNMQIAFTKKLATAMKIQPPVANEEVPSIYCWTANWTNVFSNRKEDLLVLVNNATCFCVAIYPVKKSSLKNIEQMMQPDYPEYTYIKEWAGSWTSELWEWEKGPRRLTI